MSRSLQLLVPLLLLAPPVAAQDTTEEAPAAESEGPITRQTAHRETPLVDFEYSWPQAINSEPKLVAQLQADLSTNYDEALANARENKTLIEQNNGTFNQNFFTRVWSLEGETPRFFSLLAKTDTFTGGAHPNHNSSALLWNRPGDAEVDFADLFESTDSLAGAIRAQFCKLLDAERAKRRGGEVIEGDFSECPAFSELTIFPADSDGNGRFESINLIADPYVAGPYAEGDYNVDVGVSPAVISALKPEYRSDFEVQRAQ